MRLRLPSAAAAVATLLLVPGCLAHGPITARDALPAALKEAHAWDPGARLLSVGGAEMADAQSYLAALRTLGADDKALADGTTQLLPGNDGDLGDGRLPAWGFTFGHGGNAQGTLRVVVDASGKATFSKEFPGTPGNLPDLATDARWRVDSGHALDALRGNATLARIHASASGVLTYSLDAAPAGAALRWEVDGSEHGVLNQTFHARVDAGNGSLVRRTVHAVVPAAPEVPLEAGQHGGTATAATPDAFTFPLAAHGRVHLLLRVPGSPVPGQVRATVASPDGQAKTLDASALLPGSGADADATVGDAAAGPWSATVEVPVGVSEAYTLYWCSDGAGAAPDNPAC